MKQKMLYYILFSLYIIALVGIQFLPYSIRTLDLLTDFLIALFLYTGIFLDFREKKIKDSTIMKFTLFLIPSLLVISDILAYFYGKQWHLIGWGIALIIFGIYIFGKKRSISNSSDVEGKQ